MPRRALQLVQFLRFLEDPVMIGRAAVPLLLLALSSLGASARGASWTLPDLLAEMAAIESSEAVFRQEVHVSYLSEPMRYRGRVRYRAPDFVRIKSGNARDLFPVGTFPS